MNDSHCSHGAPLREDETCLDCDVVWARNTGGGVSHNVLSPCPFCGCALFLDRDFAALDKNAHELYVIKCPDCPAGMTFFSSTTQQAIERWNTRAAVSDKAVSK